MKRRMTRRRDWKLKIAVYAGISEILGDLGWCFVVREAGREAERIGNRGAGF